MARDQNSPAHPACGETGQGLQDEARAQGIAHQHRGAGILPDACSNFGVGQDARAPVRDAFGKWMFPQ